MRGDWPELTSLSGAQVAVLGQTWRVRRSDVLEDQRSKRLALLLDLESDSEVISARPLFPAETHAVDHSHQMNWILDSLKAIIESGRLRQDGIYAIG